MKNFPLNKISPNSATPQRKPEVEKLGLCDYYPFGMVMPERNFSYETYRFGFNGKESDNEVKSNNNSYDFGARVYDPRIARWISIDPKQRTYTGWSPYNSFNCNPILFADPDGMDGVVTIKKSNPLQVGNKIYAGGTLKNPNELTVKANYYYNASTLHYQGAEKALQDAIGSYNNSSFTVKGVDGQYYKVKFELSSIPVAEVDPNNIKQNYAANDFYQEDLNYDTYAPYGNTIGSDIPDLIGLDPGELGAATRSMISLDTKGIDKAVVAGADLFTTLYNVFLHEIGHNLGGAHNDEGAMNSSTTVTEKNQITTNNDPKESKYSIKNRLTGKNVEKLISTIWEGGRTNERPGQLKEIQK